MIGKWVPKPDRNWIRMMKRRAEQKERRAAEALLLARKLLAVPKKERSA